MGQYYKIVNLDKKEYLHPHSFNIGAKACEMLGSFPGVLAPLFLLQLSSPSSRGGGDLDNEQHFSSYVLGRWVGDRVVIIGDDAHSDDIEGVNAKQVYDRCINKKDWDASPRSHNFMRRHCYLDISYIARKAVEEQLGFKYREERDIQDESARKDTAVRDALTDLTAAVSALRDSLLG